MLDHRYFNRVATKRHSNHLLESYKAVHARSTIVLFSRKTHTPLAALTLKSTKDIGCLSMLTGRPSPKNNAPQPYFQGMLNMPNQNFSFVITNLSDDGMINFNVLHTPHRVSEVNPGPSHGINEVNELHVRQSYEIKADQRTNRSMVLKGKTKARVDPITNKSDNVPLTVDESETIMGDKTKEGLYFYLSVVPDISSPALVNKFKEGTVWKAVPGFVRKTTAPSQNSRTTLTFAAPPVQSSRSDRHLRLRLRMAAKRKKHLMGMSRSYCKIPGATSYRSAEHARSMPQVPTATATTDPYIPHRQCSRQDPGLHDAFYSDFADWNDYDAEIEPENGAPDTAASFEGMIQEKPAAAFDFAGEFGICNFHSKESQKGAAGELASNMKSAKFNTNVDVGSTQAGELVYGEHVNVQSSSTGHEYAYNFASEPTVLCMSIWEDMKFLPLLDTVEKMLEEEMTEWISNEGKALIESLNTVYKEEKCVIDLESEADTIVCTCGHQCINHASVNSNLRRCPLCRSPVTAFVRADGVVI